MNINKFTLCAIRCGTMIFVDDVNKWRDKDINLYPGYEECSFKQVPVRIDSWGFSIVNSYCDYRNLENVVVLKRDADSKVFCLGSTFLELTEYLEGMKDEYKMFLPVEVVEKNLDNIIEDDLVLCYVENGCAFFTNNPNQTGEDWDKSFYEQNAGWPDRNEGYKVEEIKFYVSDTYLEPCEYFNGVDLSVEKINKKFVPWLTPTNTKCKPIFAGEPMKSFCEIITDADGTILIQIGS